MRCELEKWHLFTVHYRQRNFLLISLSTVMTMLSERWIAINVKIDSGELDSCSTWSAYMKTSSFLSAASLCCGFLCVSALHCRLFTLTTTIIYCWEVFINGEKRGSDAARLGWGAAAWNLFETKGRRNPTDLREWGLRSVVKHDTS